MIRPVIVHNKQLAKELKIVCLRMCLVLSSFFLLARRRTRRLLLLRQPNRVMVHRAPTGAIYGIIILFPLLVLRPPTFPAPAMSSHQQMVKTWLLQSTFPSIAEIQHHKCQSLFGLKEARGTTLHH